jgi:hypothetical protein
MYAFISWEPNTTYLVGNVVVFLKYVKGFSVPSISEQTTPVNNQYKTLNTLIQKIEPETKEYSLEFIVTYE